MHRRALAVDGGIGALAFDHEAQRGLRVAVMGATSPGMMSCRPQYIVCVIEELPRMPGFSSTSTRRSASSAVMSRPASIRYSRTMPYCQWAGTQGDFGCGMTSAPSTSHSGVRLSLSMRW